MYNGGTMFASEGLFALLTFLPIIIYLVLTGFGIYFIVKVMKFMNEKIKLDRERNELMRAVNQGQKID